MAIVPSLPILEIARRKLFCFPTKSSCSISVPLVIMRVTLRSIVALAPPLFFASSGVSICSQIATLCPALINFVRYISEACQGIPHIGASFRFVKTNPNSFEAISASSKNNS